MKVCKTCNQPKSFDEYYVQARNRDGYRNHCKACMALNRDPRLAKSRVLKHLYQMTIEEFETMLVVQGGLCANLACPNPGTAVDHDHSCCDSRITCGRCVRAILCRPCNVAIGMARDDVKILQGLQDYLTRRVDG